MLFHQPLTHPLDFSSILYGGLAICYSGVKSLLETQVLLARAFSFLLHEIPGKPLISLGFVVSVVFRIETKVSL